jgi:hypothetical protein
MICHSGVPACHRKYPGILGSCWPYRQSANISLVNTARWSHANAPTFVINVMLRCGLIFITYGLLQLLEVFGILPQGFIPFHEGIYSMVGACLFSFYLAYHTKLIVAGKHSKYQMNEQDYILGAMSLYNDVINLFLYTLRMIGEDKNK